MGDQELLSLLVNQSAYNSTSQLLENRLSQALYDINVLRQAKGHNQTVLCNVVTGIFVSLVLSDPKGKFGLNSIYANKTINQTNLLMLQEQPRSAYVLAFSVDPVRDVTLTVDFLKTLLTDSWVSEALTNLGERYIELDNGTREKLAKNHRQQSVHLISRRKKRDANQATQFAQVFGPETTKSIIQSPETLFVHKNQHGHVIGTDVSVEYLRENRQLWNIDPTDSTGMFYLVAGIGIGFGLDIDPRGNYTRRYKSLGFLSLPLFTSKTSGRDDQDQYSTTITLGDHRNVSRATINPFRQYAMQRKKRAGVDVKCGRYGERESVRTKLRELEKLTDELTYSEKAMILKDGGGDKKAIMTQEQVTIKKERVLRLRQELRTFRVDRFVEQVRLTVKLESLLFLSTFTEKYGARLETSARFFNSLMYAKMYMHLVGALLKKDYDGAASTTVFLGAMKLFGEWSEALIGLAGLEVYGKLTSRLLGFTGVMMGQFFSVYLFVDLLDHWTRYRAHKEGVGGVTLDGLALLFNSMSGGVLLGATFGNAFCRAILGISTWVFTVATVMMFLLADIYSAAQVTKELNAKISMSPGEFLSHMVRFVVSNEETKVMRAASEKEMQNKTILNIQALMSRSPNWKAYICENYELVSRYREKFAAKNNPWCPKRHEATSLCIVDVHEAAAVLTVDNYVNFNKNVTRYSRVFPETVKQHKRLLCGLYHEQHSFMDKPRSMLECRGMIGIEDTSKPDGLVVIQAGNGSDIVVGSSKYQNEIILAGGNKLVEGGPFNDTFRVWGDKPVSGVIRGNDGNDTVLFMGYLPAVANLDIRATKNYAGLELVNETTEDTLTLLDVEQIVGRQKKTDTIQVACNLKFVNLLGGRDPVNPDLVLVERGECPDGRATLQIIANDHTEIVSQELTGNYTYGIELAHGNAKIRLAPIRTTTDRFQFANNLTSIHQVEFDIETNNLTCRMTPNVDDTTKTPEITAHHVTLNVQNFNPNRSALYFADQSRMLIDGSKKSIAFDITNDDDTPVELVIEKTKALGDKFSAEVSASIGQKEFVFRGYPADTETTSPMSALYNMACRRTYLLGGQNTSFFMVINETQCPVSEVNILLETQSTNVVYLTKIYEDYANENKILTHSVKKTTENTLLVTITSSSKPILTIELSAPGGDLFSDDLKLMFKMDAQYELAGIDDGMEFHLKPMPIETPNDYLLGLIVDPETARRRPLLRRQFAIGDQVHFNRHSLQTLRLLTSCRPEDKACQFESVFFTHFFEPGDAYSEFELAYTNRRFKLVDEFEKYNDTVYEVAK